MVLFVGEQKVELLNSKVVVDVVDEDSSCTLIQLFQNPSYGKDDSLEAVYKFPLQSSAAVYLFQTQFLSKDGTVLSSLFGKCFEKEEAREKFNQAKETGKTAQLLEVDYDNSPDIFVMSLGNIKKECQFVKIQVAYYLPLALEEASTVKRLILPSRVSPRKGGAGVLGDWKTAFDVEINISLSSAVSMIESPSHKIQTKMNVEGSPMKAKVLLAEDDVILSTDFVLKISAAEVSKNSLIVQTPDSITNKDFASLFGDSTIAKITFMPDFKPSSEESLKNFIFVIDRSGSMSGANMTESRKALLLCLTSLPENCQFNIVSFGSSHSSLFPKSAAYSEETLKQARQHVEGMDADMGGTELLEPLQQIFGEKSDVQKIIFVLTDGEVDNTQKVVAAVKKAHVESGARLFSCGIGSGVDTHLVNGIAKMGGGTSTFIAYGERMNAKIAAQMEQAMETPFSELKIEFSELKQSGSKLAWDPSTVLPKFANPGQLMSAYVALDVKSLIDAKASEKSAIKLLGSRKGEKDAVIAEIGLKTGMIETRSNLIVPALKQQIKKVEESDFEKKSARKMAVDFAVCANIVTKYTSLVAVDENEEKKQEASTEKVPVPEVKEEEKSFYSMNTFAMAPPTFAVSKPMPRLMMTRAVPPPPMMQMGGAPLGAVIQEDMEMLSSPPAPMYSGAPYQIMQKKKVSKEKVSKQKKQSKGGFFSSLMPKAKKSQQSLMMKQVEKLDINDMMESDALSMGANMAMAERDLDDDLYSAPLTTSLKMAEEVPSRSKINAAPKSKTDLEKLDALIAIQKRDGSFVATQELFNILGVADFGSDKSAEFATAVIVQFLEMKLAPHQGEWNLMHKKAVAFIQKSGKDEADLMTKAKAVVQKI